MNIRGFRGARWVGAFISSLLLASVPCARAGDTPHPAVVTDDLAARLRHLTLDDAIDIALHRNPAILTQLQEIQRNQGNVITVRAAALPQVIAAGSFTEEDRALLLTSSSSSSSKKVSDSLLRVVDPATGLDAGTISGSQLLSGLLGSSGTGSSTSLVGGSASGQSTRNYTISIQVQQTIYNAALPPAIRQARFLRDSSYYALRETVDTIVNTVKTDFYTVLVDKALIDIQNENLRLLQSQLTDQENRFAAGTVPRFNVLQASVAVANQRPQVITATNTYNTAYIGLARVLGLQYGPEEERTAHINVVGNLDYHPQTFSADAGVNAGKQNRAILKQDRFNILSEIEAIRVAAAGYQPTLTANGGFEVINNRLTDDLGQTLQGWFYGATFNWAIFDGLASYGRVKQAKALLREARIAYEDAVNGVVQDIQTNYLALQQAKELIASQTLSVSQAEEAVRLAQARLSAGAGTQLDVLQSQTALLQTQTTELQARYSYAVTLANYEHVTGTSTVYDEAFDDPLSPRGYPSGVNTTGTAPSGSALPLGSVKTPDTKQRGSGRPMADKINAQSPDHPRDQKQPNKPRAEPTPFGDHSQDR